PARGGGPAADGGAERKRAGAMHSAGGPTPGRAGRAGRAVSEGQAMSKALIRFSQPIERRSVPSVVLLILITLGLYCLYLLYQWAKEVNRLLGRYKYNPNLVLLISIATLGLGATVIECMLAFDIEGEAAAREIPERSPSLPVLVLGLNAIALLLGSNAGGVLLLSLAFGLTATGLVQRELNRLAPAGSPAGAEPGEAFSARS